VPERIGQCEISVRLKDTARKQPFPCTILGHFSRIERIGGKTLNRTYRLVDAQPAI
jgi:hypothetical protein